MNTQESIGIFLPVRKGSERVINKNIRKFANFECGLLELKLKALQNIKIIDEIVVSTNDEMIIDILNRYSDDRIRLDRRPERLCSSDTKMDDLMSYIPKVMNCELILWTHVTSPFVCSKIYTSAINKFIKERNINPEVNSLTSVTKIKEFLWDPEFNKPLKHDFVNNGWPKTQDLMPLYEFNHAIYLIPKDVMKKNLNRIGDCNVFYEINKIDGFDIDTEEDFLIAESIYHKIMKNNRKINL